MKIYGVFTQLRSWDQFGGLYATQEDRTASLRRFAEECATDDAEIPAEDADETDLIEAINVHEHSVHLFDDELELPAATVFSDRELATVLAALRHWQRDEAPNAHAPEFPEGHELGSFFTDHEPLTEDEIDELCERINVAPGPAEKSTPAPAPLCYVAEGFMDSPLVAIVQSLRDDCGVEASIEHPGVIHVPVEMGGYTFGTANGHWQGDYCETSTPEVVTHTLSLNLPDTSHDPPQPRADRWAQDIAARIAAALTVGKPAGEGVTR